MPEHEGPAGWRKGRGALLRPTDRAWPIVRLLLSAAVGCASAASVAPGPASLAAQAPNDTTPADTARTLQSVSLDTASLGEGRYASMSTLFEKTIFGVDVLTVTVRFGPGTAAELERLVRGNERSDAIEDSVAAAAIRARDAFARIEFLRDVSLGQFLDATRKNMRKAMDAGLLDGAAFWRISRGLPRWFAFLEERKIREGDRLLYRIRGDTLRTLFVGPRGELLLDQTDVGPERPVAVLGGYLAPGADFRDGLIDSLFERVGGTGSSAAGYRAGSAAAAYRSDFGPAGTSWNRLSVTSSIRSRE